jgi:predicted enzyme related to lactoylglutathione lyase
MHWGVNFIWRTFGDPEKLGHTQWSMMKTGNDMMAEGQTAMVCYRVCQLDKYLEQLRQAGVEIIGEVESYDYGKFAHIEDDRGERIQLWEPSEKVYEGMIEAKVEMG